MDAQAIADELNQRGMTTAALFALEVGQPFALLGVSYCGWRNPPLACLARPIGPASGHNF
ncbi:MAG: hypothetical protein IPL28_13805 [Chloroflexi bacterium]|nr:hypothetical protein [Chloroflexota bacterium]